MSDSNLVGTELDMLIVGAGVAGLYALHRARAAGLKARAYDAAAGVGGTWYWNRYPGARVDIESFEYSYSFSKELQQEWSWSERYCAQPELLAYLEFVADRFDLRRDIQLSTKITAAKFDDATGRWLVELSSGEKVSAQFFVMATGCISEPKKLDIPGVDSFAGETYLTSRWPHHNVDFKGKRVAIFGTGSSAIQTIPIVAQEAEQLTVFQRTANFAVPLQNTKLTAEYEADMKRRYDEIRKREWDSFGGFIFVGGEPKTPLSISALDVSDEEREAEFEYRWQSGGLCYYTSYCDLLTDKRANDKLAEFVRKKIRDRVHDPVTAEKLMPTGYPIMTKRLCCETGYYETYNRDNVTLVDIRETPVEKITQSGIEYGGEHHPFDAIIFATGFDAVTGAILNVDIRGRNGVQLSDQWADGPQTYLGLMVAGFPNLFNVAGPGSTAALTSAIPSNEHQIALVMDCVEEVRKRGATTIEPLAEAQTDWVRRIWENASKTLFPLANSWYMGSNVPGKPRVILLDLGGFKPYIDKCDEVVSAGFKGFEIA